MPRIARKEIHGHAFHILNRANGRATLFTKDGDYRAFINVLRIARKRIPLEIFALSVLPNHFHAVVRAADTATLSAFMQLWMTTHIRRYHRYHGTSGHLWQGRFKSFPINDDAHLLTVIRYVLQNPVRAHLVRRVEEWPWSSIALPDIVDPWPMDPPTNLSKWLNELTPRTKLDELRAAINRPSLSRSSGQSR